MQLAIWREADSKRMFFSNMQSGWLHCILAVGLPACSRMLQVTRFNRNSKAKISGDFLGDLFFFFAWLPRSLIPEWWVGMGQAYVGGLQCWKWRGLYSCNEGRNLLITHSWLCRTACQHGGQQVQLSRLSCPGGLAALSWSGQLLLHHQLPAAVSGLDYCRWVK